MAIVQRCAVWNILWVLLVPALARLDDTKSIRLSATSGTCPAPCFCYSSTINCANNELLQLPVDAGGRDVKVLDASSNVLFRVPISLHQLLPSLEKLELSHNHIVTIEADDFVGLKYLKYLDLSNNRLTVLSSKSFGSLPGLRELHLNRNRLSQVPTRAFSVLTDLSALSLGGNLISSISANAFFKLNNLTILDLKNNYLRKLDDEAFAGLGKLSVLKLSGNRLKEVRNGVLQRAPALERIVLRGNPIAVVDRDAFSRLPQLEELELSAVRGLTDFPNLNGTIRIDDLRIYGTQMTSVPDDLCVVMTNMKRMYLPSNKLERLPKLEACNKLRLIDLSYNEIESISGSLFRSQVHLQDLLLNHNRISEITADAFVGLTKLQILNLRQNRISSIAETAFEPLPSLHRLNLNDNAFTRLPSVGLTALTHLHCSGIREMREFPAPEEFPSLQLVEVSYAYHCCQFGRSESQLANANHTLSKVTEKVYFPSHDQFDFSRWRQNVTDIWSDLHNGSGKLDDFGRELLEDFGSEYSEHLPTYLQETANMDYAKPELQPIGQVICTPEPTTFMPCEDLFDWWSLRCGVWVVFLLALLGNGVVVFVLIFARSKLDVPRFLVCNLAAADFFMGLYLGFLAVVDATTMGEFRKYAIAWQMSVGCQMAGFFGVFSSELSVFTLAVITMERNYAITHAMHLNKRLSLRRAGYIMVGGWLFAMVTALLPLFGISDYRRFAVCLPFQTAGAGIGYVVFLMLINGFAFVILMGCYWKMYCAIRGSQAWNSNDSRIAKRMALLVFSDFLCWAPIAFFVLSSAAGVHLIGLSGAKVFTVFVLPFNSCCNPFLYAILTKQFKKDCVTLCKAIEESRVSRGIGRGRHSSNFSNRHTPANTNSLGERTSKGSIRCRCSQALVLDPAQKKTYRRWKKFRAIWCPAMRKEHGVDSGNNYAFQIAEIQKDQEKSKRNPSFSSDNFSSSRSDSLRTHTRTVKLRRNSWSVTRKPSQDSNLSTSRNDSSITAGSQTTQSWQMSRSSVSSDTSNPFLQRALSNAAEFSDGSLRSRPLHQQTYHDPDHMCIVPQNSSRNLLFRYSLKKQASSGILKNKPPLTRQSAVSQDVAMVAGQVHKIGCPLHSGGAPASVIQARHRSIRDKLLQPGHESTPSFERNLVNDTKQLSRISAMMDAKAGTFSSSTASANDVYVDFRSRQLMSPVSVSANEERSLKLNRASSLSERRFPSTHTVALRSVSLNVPAAPAARRWLSAVDLHQAESISDGGALQHALLQTNRSAVSAMTLHVSQSAVPPDVQGWLQAVRCVRDARVDAQDAVGGGERDLLDTGRRRDATEAELCPLMR